MHRARPLGALPDRVELVPPEGEDHRSWILGDRPRRRRTTTSPGPAAGRPEPVAVHDSAWVTRLL